jgi:hypothetical protein
VHTRRASVKHDDRTACLEHVRYSVHVLLAYSTVTYSTGAEARQASVKHDEIVLHAWSVIFKLRTIATCARVLVVKSDRFVIGSLAWQPWASRSNETRAAIGVNFKNWNPVLMKEWKYGSKAGPSTAFPTCMFMRFRTWPRSCWPAYHRPSGRIYAQAEL